MSETRAERVLRRAGELRSSMDFAARSRWRVRAIMDGGPTAIKALMGDELQELGDEDLPWPNLMLSGLTRAAQKIGHKPTVRVAAPEGNNDEAPRLRAEKRERIVEAYDEVDRLDLQLSQVGRWLPGYGFAVWTIGMRLSAEGIPYPAAELRDPYDCYPGEWGVHQQPRELAVARRISIPEAKRLFPAHAEAIDTVGTRSALSRTRTAGGGVLLSSSAWENQTGRGLEIVEYYDDEGSYILLPDAEAILDFTPNPLKSGPAFVVAKRFAFHQLTGQYDHVIGLMAAITRINVLAEIAMQDGVFTETNVYGDMDGQYKKGRFEVNYLPPNSKVDKPQSNVPYQTFEHANRMERQFRIVAGYPVQDDAQSPLAFATGRGLEELNSSVSEEVREYQKVLRFALQDLDSKRLEMDEMVSATRKKPLAGTRSGIPHSETYIPVRDIKGDFRTGRVYGLMAAWDDPAKLVGGTQLLGADVIDVITLQENIDGLDNLAVINERIRQKKSQELLYELLGAAAQQNDPRALAAFIEMQPQGEDRRILEKYFLPQEEDPAAGGEAGIPTLPGGGGPAPGGPPEPMQTVLTRLRSGDGGVQTVAQL